MFEIESPDLALCDFDHPADISYRLYIFGQLLMSRGEMLADSLKNTDFFNFVFNQFDSREPFDRFKLLLNRYHDYRQKRPPMEKRMKMIKELHRIEGYRANHQFLFLLAQIWMIYSNPVYSHPDHIRVNAVMCLVEHTNTLEAFLMSGSSTFTAMSVSFWESAEHWLRNLLLTGFLSSLVTGAVRIIITLVTLGC